MSKTLSPELDPASPGAESSSSPTVTAILNAAREAVREELVRQKRSGHSIVVWRNGKTVLLPPEEIEV